MILPVRAPYDDDPAGQGRTHGLRRLSRLTWRATQLGALATVGFAVVFARTAPAATVTGHTPPKAAATPSASPSPSPSPSPKPSVHRHHRHHKPAAAAAPAPSQSLTPPATPPAPSPSPVPSPVQTTSSPSPGGG